MKDSQGRLIDPAMTVKDMIVHLAKGNVGAATVLASLLTHDPVNGPFILLDMDEMGLRGSQIWIAYKDHCRQNIEQFTLRAGRRDVTLLKERYP